MGGLCSKSSTHSGGHTVLESPGTAPARREPAPVSRPRPAPSAATGGAQPSGPGARTAAAEAAEQRLKAEKVRGTTSTNPKRGRLAAQLEASKSAPRAPEPREEQQLVWD